jgi:O-antigen/teichoic acid export membrane protein
VNDPVSVEAIRRRVLSGVAWKALSAVVRQVSRIATAVILARLLSPHDYGIAGMVLVLSSLVLIFADLAFGAALVQRPELTEEDRSTVFWTNAAGGLLFTLGGIALSGPVAAFYGQPAVKPLFAAFSITFLVTALSSTQSALLSREMNFRSLELRQMLSYGAGAIVGIVAAAEGAGAWALISQQITIAVASTVLLTIFSPWRPKLLFSFASLRSMAGFSGRVFLTRLLFYANRNADNILVGRFIGSAALGAYALAYNVMLMPFSQISSPIQEVLFPAFSRVQHDTQRIAGGWLRVNRMVGAISIPSLLGLIIVAPDFVHVVLGHRWAAATPVIQILSWVGLVQSLQGLNSSILEARNRTQDLLRYSVVVLTASLIAFVGGLHWGIVGVATGYAISTTLVEPYYTLLTARAVELPLRTFVASLRGVAEAAILMAAAVLGTRVLLVGAGAAPFARLVLCIVAGGLVYFPACAWRAPELLAELRALRPRGRRAPAVGAPQPSEP